MKKIIIFVFLSLNFPLVFAWLKEIKEPYLVFLDYSKQTKSIKDAINNSILTFSSNTWTINCDKKEEKCSIETPWIYSWEVIISTKIQDKIIKSDYYTINKLDYIIESLEFDEKKLIRNDKNFLYSYKNAPDRIKEIIKSGWIYVVSEKWDIKCEDEICYINTKQVDYGRFYVRVKSKNKTLKVFNYKIKKYNEMLDISDSIKYKSLQKYSLSCEIRRASDIISAIKWQKIDEDELIDKIEKTNFFGKKAVKFDWDFLWWNPNFWFVWDIKWNQFDLTWYWVLENPISVLYKKYKISNKIITNKNYNSSYWQKEHLAELFIALNKWNFVQLWWDRRTNPDEEDWILDKVKEKDLEKWLNWKNYSKYWRKDRKISWNYMKDWNLTKIEWLNWEHAFYLLWYEWELDNPKKIIVWDTKTWKHKYNTKEWLRKWNLMQNKSIIVYK